MRLCLVPLVISLSLAACAGTVRPPKPSFADASRPIELAGIVSVEARVPASGVIGAFYDGAARVAQKTYRVENLKGAIGDRVSAAARAYGLKVGAAGSGLVLKIELPTLSVETYGLFASGEPQIDVAGTMEIDLPDGSQLYSAPIMAKAKNEENEAEALFKVLDGAIAVWFAQLSNKLTQDQALAARFQHPNEEPRIVNATGTQTTTETVAFVQPVLHKAKARTAVVATVSPDWEAARDSQRYRVGRIFLSPFFGYLFGGAAQVGVLLAANQVCNDKIGLELEYPNNKGCGIGFAFAGLGAALIMVPAGVAISSSWLDGDAGYGAAFLGALVGLLAPFSIATQDIPFGAALTIGSLIMPVSSMIVYEMTAWIHESRVLTSSSQLAIAPVLTDDMRGVTVGFSF